MTPLQRKGEMRGNMTFHDLMRKLKCTKEESDMALCFLLFRRGFKTMFAHWAGFDKEEL